MVNAKNKAPKWLSKAPFGIQTKRFATIGFHPGLDPSGSLNAAKQKLGPGDYDPKPFECAYKKSGSVWDKMVKSEEFSKNFGFRNANILEYRRYMLTMGGPGTYDIPEQCFKRKSCSVLENVTFGNNPRFFRLEQNIPPPGTYFPKLIKQKCFNPLPSFEWDGFVDRFRGINTNFKRPPNLYTPNDAGSIENRMKPVSKKKLPYCLFSGVRDGTSIKNHFAPVRSAAPDKYYDWQEGMGLNYLLRHPSKSRNGKFFRDQRFRAKPTIKMMQNDIATCYKDPNTPSPATYHIKAGISKLPESLYPFNDSVRVARKGVKWEILPGTGRYNVKQTRCKMHRGQTSVFKSKTGRTEYKAPVYTYY